VTSIVVCFVLSCWDLPNQSVSCCALGIFGMLKVYFTKFQSKGVEDIDFFSGFCCWKFKQIAKIGFGRKN
jgi:hypothetical protein